MVLTICRLSAATPLVGRPTPVSLALLSSLSRLALLPRALPLGGVARTERTHVAAHAWREGLCVSRTRPHALCVPHPRLPFAPWRKVPFVVLSPWRKVPSSFPFERLLPPFAFHFSTPLAGVAFSDFRRISRSRCEGLCVTRTASLTSTRFAFQYPLSALTPASRINSQNGYQFNPPLHCHRSSLSSSLSRSSLAAPSLLQILGLVLGLLHRSWIGCS